MLVSFYQADTNLDITWKGWPQLEDCLPYLGLWGHFMNWWLLWEGSTHYGPCHPWSGGHGLYKKTNWASLEEKKTNWASKLVWGANQQAAILHDRHPPCLQVLLRLWTMLLSQVQASDEPKQMNSFLIAKRTQSFETWVLLRAGGDLWPSITTSCHPSLPYLPMNWITHTIAPWTTFVLEGKEIKLKNMTRVGSEGREGGCDNP